MKLLKRIGKIALISIPFLSTTACSVFGLHKEEQVSYSVLKKEDDFEIRRYATHIVAQTSVPGAEDDMRNKAFRRLFKYIDGNNISNEKVEMTAPVVASKTKSGEKIAMTAPVLQSEQTGIWVMSFSMPVKYTMAELPKPTDQRIVLKQIPEQVVAAIRYSGTWSQQNNQEYANKLQQWVGQQNEYTAASSVMFAAYDPPWTLPFLRRNEALIVLRSTSKK